MDTRMNESITDWDMRWLRTESDLAALVLQFGPLHDLPKEVRLTQEIQAKFKVLRDACIAIGNERIAMCIARQKQKNAHSNDNSQSTFE